MSQAARRRRKNKRKRRDVPEDEGWGDAGPPPSERAKEAEALQAMIAQGSWKSIDLADEVKFGFEQEGFGGLQVLEYPDEGLLEVEDIRTVKGNVHVEGDETGDDNEDKSSKKRKKNVKGKEKTESEEAIAEPTTKAAKKKKKSKGKKNTGQAAENTGQAAEKAHIVMEGDVVEDGEDMEEGDVEQLDMSAWKEFGLPKPVLQALQHSKFTTPTPIQSATIPVALGEQCDVLAAAETGSGKTLSFAIPVVAQCLRNPQSHDGLRALILTPTRELAMQVHNHIKELIKFTNMKVS